MIGLLRFVGLTNAGIWVGMTFFFTLVAGPAFFSADMLQLFGAARDSVTARYYAGSVAQIQLERYFFAQQCCGAVALVHLVLEGWYLGRPISRLTLFLVVGLFGLAMLGGYGFQPKLRQLHRAMYQVTSEGTVKPEPVVLEQQTAQRSFRLWHAASQLANLVGLAGTLTFLWRTQNQPEPTRFLSPIKFHLE